MALQLLIKTYSQTSIYRSLHSLKSTILVNSKPRTFSSKPTNFDSITNPLQINANVQKDTLIYKYANEAFFRNMSIFGGFQFLFWMYLMRYTYQNLKDISPEEESKRLGLDKDSLPWWRTINLGANLYRNGLSAMCAIFGSTVLFISLAYPSRAVKSLHLLKGGERVRIQTYSIFKNSRKFTTNLETVSCLQARQESKPQIAMKIQGRWLFYMLDKRGRFYKEELFDYVIGLRRKF